MPIPTDERSSRELRRLSGRGLELASSRASVRRRTTAYYRTPTRCRQLLEWHLGGAKLWVALGQRRGATEGPDSDSERDRRRGRRLLPSGISLRIGGSRLRTSFMRGCAFGGRYPAVSVC